MSRIFSPLGFLTLLLAVCAFASLAWSHDWYDAICCDDQDCRPAAPGEVVERDGGYLIRATGEHFPYKAARVSQDSDFHVCQFTTSSGAFSQSVPVVKTRCLYVPLPGS